MCDSLVSVLMTPAAFVAMIVGAVLLASMVVAATLALLAHWRADAASERANVEIQRSCRAVEKAAQDVGRLIEHRLTRLLRS